jgi:hypothetical protein
MYRGGGRAIRARVGGGEGRGGKGVVKGIMADRAAHLAPSAVGSVLVCSFQSRTKSF